MKIMPYIEIPNIHLDDHALQSAVELFSQYPDTMKSSKSDIIHGYGLDSGISEYPDLINFKLKLLKPMAEHILSSAGLSDDFYTFFIMETLPDVYFDWHIDPGVEGLTPTAGINYNFDTCDVRSPTWFDYNGTISTVSNYKCILMNAGTPHKVDNRGFGKRMNFRINLYNSSYEEYHSMVTNYIEKSI